MNSDIPPQTAAVFETSLQKITATLKPVKRKIAVYSGKGGVGKTTLAVNLAALAASQGKQIGLLDADIDCPNTLALLGVPSEDAQVLVDKQKNEFTPAVVHGLSVLSFAGLASRRDNVVLWRGPLVHKALVEFLQFTPWGTLDCLFIDAPPGTSDVPISLAQLIPDIEFLIVTGPSAVSLEDARKAILLARKLDRKVLGVVENMSGEVFGSGGGEKLAKEMDVPFLGSIPLNKMFTTAPSEHGKPAVLVDEQAKKEIELVLDKLSF